MKKFQKMMALLLVCLMMVGVMSMGAWAADPPTGGETPAATDPTGSITVNSPVVGATYSLYKIFDMTTNGANAFSYTINENSPFYGAVVTYAKTEDSGLTLTRITNSNPATYNVSVDESKFNAQAFGQAMQAVLETGSPAVEADTAETNNLGTGIVAKVAGETKITADASKVCAITDEDNNSDQIKFDNLELGYFLINPTYPPAAAVTVTMGDNYKFTAEEDLDEDGEFTDDADTKISNYVVSQIGTGTTDEKFIKYLTDNGITTNEDGSPLNDAGKQKYYNELEAAMTADAKEKIKAAFENNSSENDINVKESILVFLDSSQPEAVINEKNEINKWDIPVNPTADVQPGTPSHGDPEGGKNIIVQEETDTTPAYAADWSEAEIGESVHFQLRVNAMNFIRTGDTDATVQQVKEYFFADYPSAHMTFDESKGLHVSVLQGEAIDDENTEWKNVTKKVTVNEEDGTVSVDTPADGYLDYTSYAIGDNQVFFKNSFADSDGKDIFGTNTGIMVPWVTVVENPDPEELATLTAQFPIYTITNVPVAGTYKQEALKDGDEETEGIQPIPVNEVDDDGNWGPVEGQYVSVNNRVVDGEGYLLDDTGNKIQDTKPVYTFSLYNSDVTIVVDYWMILGDDAIVDEPGNKNYAQYAWNPVDNKDQSGNPKTPSIPGDDDVPSQKEEVDEATVYTFAIAWVKVDEKGNQLPGAKFELPFYVKKTLNGANATENIKGSYVFAFETLPETLADGDSADNYTNIVETTAESAIITIKGVEEGTYDITETEAPSGYNKLVAPFTVEAKKSGPSVTTKTQTIIYLDRDGNVTNTVTTATTTYNTDEDSYNNSKATEGEETSVPVYQFDPVVNRQGTELPSTGGIGTTIFYVVGGVLVVAAGVLLVTKRRMGVEK